MLSSAHVCGWCCLNFKHSFAPLCTRKRPDSLVGTELESAPEHSASTRGVGHLLGADPDTTHRRDSSEAGRRLGGEGGDGGPRLAPGAHRSQQPPEAPPSRPAGSKGAGSRTPPSGCLRPAGQPRSSSGRECSLPRPSRSRAPAPGPAPGGNPRPRFPLPAASARIPDPWGPGRPRRQRPGPTAHYDIFLPGLRRLRRHREPDTARLAPANPGARHRPSDGSVHQ